MSEATLRLARTSYSFHAGLKYSHCVVLYKQTTSVLLTEVCTIIPHSFLLHLVPGLLMVLGRTTPPAVGLATGFAVLAVGLAGVLLGAATGLHKRVAKLFMHRTTDVAGTWLPVFMQAHVNVCPEELSA